MELNLTEAAKEDIKSLNRSGRSDIVKKIEKLLTSIKETPFTGIGKPELLKYQHSGKWSRRISYEHRIVHEVIDDVIFVYSAKGHYH
jgi:toxin YoeB